MQTNPRKPRCFVLEHTKVAVDAARSFGEVVHLFEPGEERSSIWSDAFEREVLDALDRHRFNANVDYFVMTGHLVPISTASLIIMSHYGCVRLLYFHSTHRDYVLREMRNERDFEAAHDPG